MGINNYRKIKKGVPNTLMEHLDIDDRDLIILNILSDNPRASQEDIGKQINLSQPSVWARRGKLLTKGIIETNHCANLKVINLTFAFLNIKSNDVNRSVDFISKHEYVVNIFNMIGPYDLMVMIYSIDIQDIYKKIVQLSKDDSIRSINTGIVTRIKNTMYSPLRYKARAEENDS